MPKKAYPKERGIFMRKILWLLLIFASTPAFAFKLSAVGAVDWSTPNVIGSNYKANPAFGGGALLETSVMPFVGFEIGALSLTRSYEDANKTPTKRKMMEVPVLLKAYLGHSIAFGAGAYYAKYDQAGLNQSPTDYGLATNIALYYRVAKFTKLLLDARYTMGIKNNNTGIGTTHYNDVLLLTGLQLGF